MSDYEHFQAQLQLKVDDITAICEEEEKFRGSSTDKVDWHRRAKHAYELVCLPTQHFKSMRYPGEDPERYVDAKQWIREKLKECKGFHAPSTVYDHIEAALVLDAIRDHRRNHEFGYRDPLLAECLVGSISPRTFGFC